MRTIRVLLEKIKRSLNKTALFWQGNFSKRKHILMAVVSGNKITQGLKGKIGNMIFRSRNGKTFTYILTKKAIPHTVNQKKAQSKFAEAVAKAKAVINNETERKKFEKLALKTNKSGAFNAAVSWFMKEE